MKRWIRIAGPGEFRGEGEWVEVNTPEREKLFKDARVSAYLPVAWSVDDHKPIFEAARPDVYPNYAVVDGVLIHQFHKLAVPVIGTGPQALQYAQRQLLNLLKSKLEVDHVA